jgi:hypothetical protein
MSVLNLKRRLKILSGGVRYDAFLAASHSVVAPLQPLERF